MSATLWIRAGSRSAGQKAGRTLQEQATLRAPRGNPAQGAATKHRSADPGYTVKSPIAVSSNIANILMAYIQRNIPYEAQKAIAISVMAVAMSRWNCGVVDAANRATECCGFNAEALRRWFRAFSSTTSSCSLENMTDKNITTVLSSRCGQHDNHAASLVNDERFCLAAREYVRKHACKKGEPNLTSTTFTEWVESEYNTSICEETARTWLLKLGFSRVYHQKGVYFDGHERDDVVVYRSEFVKQMEDLDKKSITCEGNTPSLQSGEKPLIRVVHDECT